MRYNKMTKQLMEVIQSFEQLDKQKAVSIAVSRDDKIFRYVLEVEGSFDCYEGCINEYKQGEYAFGSVFRQRVEKQQAINWCREILINI